ncbi:MAG TPA: SH3 domain-containing protein [Candidatus Limnocylindrales bacterium]|nr:SH3 domain-containing protein [Candidatus Limnocylindrales bacterium]
MLRTFGASTTATTATAMALFIFKRRREREEDEVPPAEPSPYEIPRDDPIVAQQGANEAGAPVDPESLMPRWRRPSLRAARLSKPGVSVEAVEAERLTFDGDPAAGEGALERRRIGYRMVRLGDGPDEILSNEIGRLDEGDEVELLQRSGVYWQVRTPLGQVGWVHKTTLGDPVDAAPRQFPAVAPDEDPDVLQAFRETQLRRLAVGSETPLGEGLASRLIRERLEGGRAD